MLYLERFFATVWCFSMWGTRRTVVQFNGGEIWQRALMAVV